MEALGSALGELASPTNRPGGHRNEEKNEFPRQICGGLSHRGMCKRPNVTDHALLFISTGCYRRLSRASGAPTARALALRAAFSAKFRRFSGSAARSEGEQGRTVTPPSPPWAQWAPETGWRWSRGSNLVTGPLGSVAGEPDRRQRQLLCLLPVQVAGAWQAGRCVCSAHGPSPQMQVQSTAAGVAPLPTPSKISSGDGLPNSAFHLSSSQSFLERASGKGHSTALSCGISYSEATT
jgi:hypothetical protein